MPIILHSSQQSRLIVFSKKKRHLLTSLAFDPCMYYGSCCILVLFVVTSKNSGMKTKYCLVAVGISLAHGLRYSILQIIDAHYWVELDKSAHSTKQGFYQSWYLTCKRYINDEYRYSIALFFKEISCFSLYFVYVCLKFIQKVRILQHHVPGLCWYFCMHQGISSYLRPQASIQGTAFRLVNRKRDIKCAIRSPSSSNAKCPVFNKWI
jgi:hypothetical protein